MRKIDKIIIHCAATPEGKHFTVEQIRQWHVKGNGWSDIGYHFVIYLDGYNANSIGICYVGGCTADGKKPKDTRTEAQRSALVELVAELRSQFPGATVHGHNEFANKACPSFDVSKEFPNHK